MFKDEHNINVKVFEHGGLKTGNIAKSDPLSPSMCESDNCFPCTSGRGGDCSKSCSSYRLECQECLKSELKAVHKGETGRNCYSRGSEHLAGLNNKQDDNPLWNPLEDRGEPGGTGGGVHPNQLEEVGEPGGLGEALIGGP